MITVRFFRGETGPEGTFSDVTVEDESRQVMFRCKGAELAWHDNKPNISCVPDGAFSMCKRFSPSHNRDVWHINVSGRTQVEIHSGNLAGDPTLGMPHDVQGCALLGEEISTFLPGEPVGMVKDAKGNMTPRVIKTEQRGVTRSRDTIAAFEAILGHGPAQAIFEWAPGIGPKETT